MPGPVVERGDRVTFRTVEREDAAFRQRAVTDPRVRHPLGMGRHRSEREAEDLVEAMDEGGDRLAYVVCLDAADAPRGRPDDDETTPLGLVHAYDVDSERAHLAYWLLPEYHGEGYGREAAAMLVDRAFETASVHSVSAAAFAHNEASRGLLESLGFVEEFRRREASYVDGAYRDVVEYGLLRREWQEQSF
ncbi:MAG: GNAT family N-acetyltransferase [Halobacterium sp.]